MTMFGRNIRIGWAGFFLVLGCSTAPTERTPANDEGPVREKFSQLQSAIKSGDTDKIWKLLAGKSRAEAEREAKDLQTAHAKAGAEEKAKLEQASGLPGNELAGLAGPGMLKTKRFQRKYHELPDSKIEKVVVEGENATVHFVEPDGDHEKLILVRQDGEWKAWLAMPKLSQP